VKPEELLSEIVRYAADKKAGEIVELDLRGVLGYTDYFVVCTGNTERQTKAIHDGILEGTTSTSWFTSSPRKRARSTAWSSYGARPLHGWPSAKRGRHCSRPCARRA
jgi:ribosomal silencing factor RsfS